MFTNPHLTHHESPLRYVLGTRIGDDDVDTAVAMLTGRGAT
jgi:hypothetical protein